MNSTDLADVRRPSWVAVDQLPTISALAPIRLAATFVALVLLGGCSPGSVKSEPDARAPLLRPTFPATDLSTTTGAAIAETATTAASASVPTSGTRSSEEISPISQLAPTTPSTQSPVGKSTETVSSEAEVASTGAEDPLGDRTSSIETPPPWSDLAGVRLVRQDSTYELRVRMGGGSAPSDAPTAEHSMNVASFYDVDGDGVVDYEIWLNLADDGWYPGYFRPGSEGPNRFRGASGVTVSVVGDELIASFPASHLGQARRFRWAVASEWGRHEALGTPAAARDDVPDDDGFLTAP